MCGMHAIYNIIDDALSLDFAVKFSNKVICGFETKKHYLDQPAQFISMGMAGLNSGRKLLGFRQICYALFSIF